MVRDMATIAVHDAHRHIGLLPAFAFYGGPPVNPDIAARGTVKEFLADLDAEGTERALVLPNYGVPDPAVSFSFNELALEAAAADDRVSCGLWVSPRPQDAELNTGALQHVAEQGVKVLKTIRSAEPTESASRASSAGLAWRGISGASRCCSSSDSSFLDLRDRSMSRQTLATTVVSQPPRFSMLLTSEFVRRNQASWTASSASPLEPRIR